MFCSAGSQENFVQLNSMKTFVQLNDMKVSFRLSFAADQVRCFVLFLTSSSLANWEVQHHDVISVTSIGSEPQKILSVFHIASSRCHYKNNITTKHQKGQKPKNHD